MPKNNQIKKGTRLWWQRTGTSSNQDINCPCVVKTVSTEHFTVISLDDYETSEPIKIGSDVHKKEFRQITSKILLGYVKERFSTNEERYQIAKRELDKLYENATNSQKGLLVLLTEFPQLLHK